MAKWQTPYRAAQNKNGFLCWLSWLELKKIHLLGTPILSLWSYHFNKSLDIFGILTWWMEHQVTGTQTRLAKTMARKGCKALGPRCGNGLGIQESLKRPGVQVFYRQTWNRRFKRMICILCHMVHLYIIYHNHMCVRTYTYIILHNYSITLLWCLAIDVLLCSLLGHFQLSIPYKFQSPP